MKRLFLLLVICFSAIFNSCFHKKAETSESEYLDQNTIAIHRFERLLFDTDLQVLQDSLKKNEFEYRFLFNTSPSNPSYFETIKAFASEPTFREIYLLGKSRYANLEWLEKKLGSLFNNAKKHFPDMADPMVYTLFSGSFDFLDRVIVADSFAAISIDLYNAKAYKDYGYFGLPLYMVNQLDSCNILPDIASAMAINLILQENQPKTLLDNMIFSGKIAYFAANILPEEPLFRIFRYTPEQWEWCNQNENAIWSYWIQNKLLFETDHLKLRPFINEGPTTQIFKGSPSRLAEYMGWRIVSLYMEKTGASMKSLFDLQDSQEILKVSCYKPKR